VSRRTHDDVETDVRQTGRSYRHQFDKGPDTAPKSREERESRERDAWDSTKERLKKYEGLSEAKADAACRRAREREHARKRDRGEDY